MIIGLIYNNLIYISFQGFAQLSVLFSFDYVDRINCSITFIFLFFSLVLSLTYYSFIYITNKKKLPLFMELKSPNSLDIVYYNFIIFLKKFLNGLIHSYILSRYELQIVSLLCIKIAIFSIVISLKNKSKLIVFLFDMGYILTGIFYDIILIMNCKGLPQFSQIEEI
jgi:hypothetical protein